MLEDTAADIQRKREETEKQQLEGECGGSQRGTSKIKGGGGSGQKDQDWEE